MKYAITIALAVLFIMSICQVLVSQTADQTSQPSADTKVCISCHQMVHPGIVSDWRNSRHSKLSPKMAIQKPSLERRVSTEIIPATMADNAVGCAECHTMNADQHKDSFEHNGFTVHAVVTPKDCSACHPDELKQYSQSVKYNAIANLMNNPVYLDLANKINNIDLIPDPKEKEMVFADSCLYCHGTVITAGESKTRETALGSMDFPVLNGWPNQGVGRMNPDNSLGCCTSCHPRHTFSIETARKPETCAECHKGPDVPAYKVYAVSKHGGIYSSVKEKWNFDSVPWVAGEDFSAPVCATCHVSLIATADGEVVAERSHTFNDRMANRIFGPIFAIPHPIDGNTSIIKSPSGLPIPADLDAALAKDFLIDEKEMKIRNERMKNLCRQCHSESWIDGHFELLENTIKSTNGVVLESNKVMIDAWNKKIAHGLAEGQSIFDEPLERMWVEQWLFYANSVRFTAAMSGADLGVFENGRWYMSKTLEQMKEFVKDESEED